MGRKNGKYMILLRALIKAFVSWGGYAGDVYVKQKGADVEAVQIQEET